MDRVARLFRKARKAKGLAQRDVADAAGYATTQHVSNVERGVSQVGMGTLRDLSAVLGIDPSTAVTAQVLDYKDRLRVVMGVK